MTITSVYIEQETDNKGAVCYDVAVLFETELTQHFRGYTVESVMAEARKAIPAIEAGNIPFEWI